MRETSRRRSGESSIYTCRRHNALLESNSSIKPNPLLATMPQLVWFITGCSSGLGQALALEAISRGDMVIATARNEKTLAPLAVKGATAMRLDITSDQETLNEIMGDAIAVHGRIDVLVNNAGYVLAGALEETS